MGMKSSDGEQLLMRLKRTNRLPSPPGTALKVLALCRDDTASVHEIAEVIMSDPALSGRLLRYSNSPMAAVGRPVTSVRDAVLLLGIRTVKLTALGFSLVSSSFHPKCRYFDLNQFWTESCLTAVIARRLANLILSADREEAFTAGLLSGIGRMCLAHGLEAEYDRVLKMVATPGDLLEVERREIGLDHVQFGAQILRDWELPDLLTQAVANQLTPERAKGRAQPLARAICCARPLTPMFAGDGRLTPEQAHLARGVVEVDLALDRVKWRQTAEEILSDYVQIADIFDVRLNGEASVLDLYAQAKEHLTQESKNAQQDRLSAQQRQVPQAVRSTVDALTGIANRIQFEDRAVATLAEIRRLKQSCAVVVFDLDRLREVNERHGHRSGDTVVRRSVNAIRETLRDTDLLARYGSELFVVLSSQATRGSACLLATRMRKRIESILIDIDDDQLRATISLGIAASDDYPEMPDLATLVDDAVTQLRLAKQMGRNTWCYRGRSAAQLGSAAEAPASAREVLSAQT